MTKNPNRDSGQIDGCSRDSSDRPETSGGSEDSTPQITPEAIPYYRCGTNESVALDDHFHSASGNNAVADFTSRLQFLRERLGALVVTAEEYLSAERQAPLDYGLLYQNLRSVLVDFVLARSSTFAWQDVRGGDTEMVEKAEELLEKISKKGHSANQVK